MKRASSATTLGPYSSRRRSASSSVRPSARVLNSESTSAGSAEAARVSRGDTWIWPGSRLMAV